MMRSLYSGVSGLKTHQTKMDVIGNNIANVNTTAYKSSSVTFSDLMSQTTQSASGPNATTGTGGVNARQIGLGVKSGAITMNISSQGSAQSTGNPFDIMITGDAFFVVNNGTENFFTRDGSFYVDAAGNLAMTSTGYNVMGWKVDTDNPGNIKQDTVSALKIMSTENMTYEAEATSKAYVAGIIDKNDTDVTSANGKVVNLNFYDKMGYSYTARLVFKQSDATNEYSVELDRILDSNGDEVDISNAVFGDPNTLQLKTKTVAFDSTNYSWNGTVLTDAAGDPVVDTSTIFDTDGNVIDQDALDTLAKVYGYEGSTDEFLNLVNATGTDADGNTVYSSVKEMLMDGTFPTDESWEAEGRYYTGSTVTFSSANGVFTGIGGNATVSSMTLDLSQVGGGNFSNIEIDFSSCSMVDNKGTSTVAATSGDQDGVGAGRRIGDMIGVSIQNNGMIYASYDNGMTRLLGQIATAEFANASGLEKAGDNLYSATLNSGEFDGIGVDVTANGGYMSTGQLEMSNVDLSSEFTEMITTQRGFQANSRIITVSDTLLEELTNLKR